MISGPIFPRTREGLWDLARQNLDLIEHGLTIVQSDLCLDGGDRIDGLCRDALGHPTLLLCGEGADEVGIVSRAIEMQAWVTTHGSLLEQALPLCGLRYDLPVRVIILVFDLSFDILQRLRGLAALPIEVYQARSFLVGGETMVGVKPLAGDAANGSGDGFDVPCGLADSSMRDLCSQLLDLLRRLEPTLRVSGDRYSRRFCLDADPLAELRTGSDGLELRISSAGEEDGGASFRLEEWAECLEAMDGVIRRYLQLYDLRAGGADAPDGFVAKVQPESPGRLSMDAIRRSIVDVRMTEEEYRAFGESFAEVDPAPG
ncbi:MAG: hypothetical protein QF412_10615 [Planctomycetota bacterium]|jgi:hypothetical protein|nr:hypothetical protein [Planctomycetota bacterium]